MIWMTIGKFLLGNWKVLLVVSFAGILYLKLGSFWEDYQDYRADKEQTLAQKEQVILKLTQARDHALIEVAESRSAMWEMKANEKRLELLLAEAIEQQKEIRAVARQQVEIFENHNFEALTKAKPGLIEKLANKATQERLDAFEEAFNN